MENCFNFPDILEDPSLQAPDQNHNSTEDSHITSDTKGMTIYMITTVEQSLTGYGNRIIDRAGVALRITAWLSHWNYIILK